jgi:AraC-like DNA-binding protein
MQYTRKIVDLDTGEASWVDLGDHRPLSDVASALGVGPREFRRLLLAMTLVSPEWDDVSNQFRHRLTPGAVASGFGIRHDNKGFHHSHEKTPFDVLSPLGVDYIRGHLKKARELLARKRPPVVAAGAALEVFEARRANPLNHEGKVRWLAQSYSEMTHEQISQIVGITRRAVSKHIATMERQIRTAKAQARTGPGWVQAIHGGAMALAA